MKQYILTIDSNLSGCTVEGALKKGLKLSDNIIKKIKYDCIFVNDKLLTNINDRVSLHDTIKIVLPEDKPCEFIKPNDYKLKIIYEDDYILAVLKPKGMLTHNSRGNNLIALDGAVLNYLKSPITFRAINRLDRDTSGIVLIAKDMISACAFGELMKNNAISKTYEALIVGTPKESSFVIEAPIVRESEQGMKRIISDLGKYAKTECLSVKPLENGLCIAKIKLHTGRTHQIRVHFAHIGYPLYADALYGNLVPKKTYTLHAGELEFIHPFSGEKIVLKSDIQLENN